MKEMGSVSETVVANFIAREENNIYRYFVKHAYLVLPTKDPPCKDLPSLPLEADLLNKQGQKTGKKAILSFDYNGEKKIVLYTDETTVKLTFNEEARGAFRTTGTVSDHQKNIELIIQEPNNIQTIKK